MLCRLNINLYVIIFKELKSLESIFLCICILLLCAIGCVTVSACADHAGAGVAPSDS